MADQPFLFCVASLGEGASAPLSAFVRAFSAFDAWQALARVHGVDPSSVQVVLTRAALPEGALVLDVRAGPGPVGERCSMRKVKGGALRPVPPSRSRPSR